MKNNLTLVAHNHNYDLTLLLSEVQTGTDKIQILPKNSCSKFHRVKIGPLRFIDSMAFMPGSLASLGKQFLEGGNIPKYTSSMLSNVPPNALDLLLTGKQVFPYDYFDSMDKIHERELPPRESFFNTLTQSHISEEDYKKACDVYRLAGCNSLKDYILLYVKVDTGLLCDVFLQLRQILKDQYGLDCVNYVSLPGFAWDSALKISRAKLDSVYDGELYNILQENIRGGFTSVVRRHVKANNVDTNPNFNPLNEESRYLLLVDFNSLYPTVMTGMLPTGDIKKLTPEEMNTFVLHGLENHDTTKSTYGYWVLCDTKPVSPNIARYTDELPLVLGHCDITEEDISPSSREILASENRHLPKQNRKLVGMHRAQKRMLFSLSRLQGLLALGLEIEKVHTVYRYNQSAFLAGFINGNIEARKNAASTSQKSAYKAMSNSVFGRTMLNVVKNNENIHISATPENCLKHVRSPYFKRVIKLAENRVAVVKTKELIRVNHPIYVGFQILEESKKLFYDFYYKVVKKNTNRMFLCAIWTQIACCSVLKHLA